MRLRSSLLLQLYFIDDRGARQPAGSTIASREPEIPRADVWLIQPLQTLSASDWDSLWALMRDLQIPGLLVHNQMTDSLLERVAQLDHITYLAFPGSRGVTDEGLRHLARMTSLQHLDVSCPWISDAGLEVLRHLPQLKSFKLVHHPGISDAGLRYLSSCEGLESVDLMGSGAGDGTIRALRGKAQLRSFVPGNSTTDAGLSLLHDFPTFTAWESGESGGCANAMGNPSARPTYLFLNLKAPITDRGLAEVSRLRGLFALNLYGWSRPGPFDARSSAVTPEGVRQVSRMRHLGSLSCYEPLCTDVVVRELSAMPSLRSLAGISRDESFALVSRSRSIEFLGGGNITGPTFGALARMPSLRELGVNLSQVDDESLSALPRFPVLKTIGPGGVPDHGYRHIGGCEQLESLTCMYCRGITDHATEHLVGLFHLKNYEAWGLRITDRSLEILSRLSLLEHVLLYDIKDITNAGLAALARLPRLRKITLETLPNTTPQGTRVFPENVQVDIVTGEA